MSDTNNVKKITMIIGGIIIIITFLYVFLKRESYADVAEENDDDSINSKKIWKRLRLKKCYSRSDIDAILNLVPGTYEKIEKGKVQPDTETVVGGRIRQRGPKIRERIMVQGVSTSQQATHRL